MTDEEKQGSGLHIDSDWKAEAAREKQRLAEEEQRSKAAQPGQPGQHQPTGDEATFMELINLVAMQAAIALGGFQGPGGEQIPANPAAAQHHIDMLDVLQKKTQGNLTDEEQRMLSAVLHELRLAYVQVASRPPGGGTAPPGQGPPPQGS